jgi:DNA-binding cell septation regulator SpoVG
MSGVAQLRPEAGIVCRRLARVDKGSLIGSCDLEIVRWNLVLYGCTWANGKNGEFIGLPSQRYVQDGKTSYKALVQFSTKEANRRFQEAALAAVRLLA